MKWIALFLVGVSFACSTQHSGVDGLTDSGVGDSASSDAGTAPDLGFADPERVGFHHAALVYKREKNREPQAFLPYVAWQTNGRPRSGQWLFDAFVFLAFQAPSGVLLDYGASTQTDWEAMLDVWFGPASAAARGDVGALDDAISATVAATTAEGTPMGPVPHARHITVVMPWMNPAVTDFGDVDGDGTRENLSRSEDRARVAKWYAAKARERFQARHYSNLDLWGMYFMREDITPEDARSLPSVTAAIRAEGLRTLWIPYYAAPGWDRWSSFGFDVAILQPSYAFRSWLDGGRVTRSRLHVAADQARNKGLGIEIEARGQGQLPAERRILREYLADGARERFGYQQAASVYFLGEDFIEKISSNPEARALYDDTAAYVRGQTVPDPDLPIVAGTTIDPNGTTTARADLNPPLDLRGVHIDLDEVNGTWFGHATVRVRRQGGGTWEDAGWALRASPDRVSGPTRWQTLTVPVPAVGMAKVEAMEVVLTTTRSQPSAARPPILRIRPDIDFSPQSQPSLARGADYTVSPGPGASSLPDSTPPAAPKLTDGQISVGWNSGQNIGWKRDPGELAVVFDLGKTRSFTRARIHTQGGTDGAVNWPLNLALLLSPDAPRIAPEGVGVPSLEHLAFAGGDPVITGRHGPHCTASDGFAHCTDLDGYIEIAPTSPIQTRYVTVFTEAKGWVMLSEVQIEADGAPLANVPYAIRTYPTSNSAPAYADDRRRLTDGVVADSFLPALVSGWPAATDVRVDVALDGAATSVKEVTLWSQALGAYGIDPPATIRVETSSDGSAFTALGEAKRENAIAFGAARGYRVAVAAPVTARRVRISIPRSGGADRWTMISEIDVR